MTALEATVQRVLERFGTVHTIRRTATAAGSNGWTDGVTTQTYFQCTAREYAASSANVNGAAIEGASRLSILASTCPSPPRVGDWIAQGTYADDLDVSAEWSQIVAPPEVRREAGLPRVYVVTVKR